MEQNTQEWLDFRRTKVGASDCPAILGLSPYKTPYQVWEEKVFGVDTFKNAGMLRGQALEEKAREEFERISGVAVMPKIMVSKERDWQMASFDGVSFEGDTFVEIKCPNKEVHGMALKGKLPDHYMAQMQHQLAVMNVKMGFYFSFDGSRGAVVEVPKDEKYIDMINEVESTFYHEYMVTKSAPPMGNEDYVHREDSAWVELANEWAELSRYIKSLEASEEEIRAKLIALTNGQSTRGAGIRLTRSICKGAVDYKKIPELLGVDLEPYRKGSFEKWVLASCKKSLANKKSAELE